jgi:hypothetical protein
LEISCILKVNFNVLTIAYKNRKISFGKQFN